MLGWPLAKREPITEPKKRNGPIAPWKKRFMAGRRAEAEERQRARDARGDEGQLQRLDTMFGAGKGAERERERLVKRVFKGFGGEQAA